MAGTRTAPLVDGTPNANKVSFHWIDASGEKRSDSLYLDLATTDAEIEALAAAAQAISNASLWKITQVLAYVGAETKTNAVAAVFEDVAANLVFQVQDSVQSQSIRSYIPSPLQTVTMVAGGTEIPDPNTTEMVAYLAALTAAVVTGWSVVGVRFTQRRDLNNQVKL